eukprot:jgi/Ulvmu1/2104/UM125_0008.1
MARDGARWRAMARDGARWRATARDGARRRAMARDGARWRATARDGARRRAMARDGARWRATARDGAQWRARNIAMFACNQCEHVAYAALRFALAAYVLTASGRCCARNSDHMDLSLAEPARSLLQNSGQQAASPTGVAAPASSSSAQEPAGSPMGTSAPPAPTQLPAALAAITPVGTAKELQTATRQPAQDIEIRAHLDLRSLQRSDNRELQVLLEPTDPDSNKLALTYAFPPLRSIRGNCSDPDATTALGLSPAEAAGMLPLKPFQCAVLVHDTFLMMNRGRLLIDNVYLLLRRTAVVPDMSFIVAGGRDNSFSDDSQAIRGGELVVSNVTFHGEHRGNAAGIKLEVDDASLLAQDCIFTDWGGSDPPVQVMHRSVANIHRTVFRNMHLASEVVDVSWGGAVRLVDVAFANVTLERGAVVSTADNDYRQSVVANVNYYAEDDESYDVDVAEVAPEDAGVFGEEFHVAEAVMSDCVFLPVRPATLLLPGCPPPSAAARARVMARETMRPDAEFGREVSTDDVLGEADIVRLEASLVAPDATWLVQTLQVLPTVPPVPSTWPPFVLDPPARPQNRTSLALEPLPAAATGGLWGPLSASPPPAILPGFVPPDGAAADSDSDSGRMWVLIVLIAAICITLVAALGALWRFIHMKRHRQRTAQKNVTAEAAQRDDWRSTHAAAGSAPVRQPPTITASSDEAPTDPETYVAAMFTRGGTISSTDLAFTSFPALVGFDSAASNPRNRSRLHSSLSRGGSLHPEVSLAPEASLAAEPSLQRDRNVPASALNPNYDYALPPALALIAQELDKDASVTSEDLYNPTKPSIADTTDADRTDTDTDSGAIGGPSAADRTTAAVPTPLAVALHRGAHTLVNAPLASVPSAASTASPGAVSMTEPGARGAAALMCQASLDAHSDAASGSTIVVSPFDSLATQTTHSMRSTVSTDSTDMYVPPAASAAPAAIPEDEEVVTAEVLPPSAASGRVAASTRGIGSTQRASTSTVTATRSTNAPSSKLGLSTTDALLVDENIRTVLKQLDRFKEKHKFLDKYILAGREGRRRGGQAVVQFCRGADDDCEYAIKFFLDHDAFVTEASLFAACFPSLRSHVSLEVAARADATIEAADSDTSISNVPLSEFAARFLPQIEAVCDSTVKSLVDPRGRPMPPCIIMEKGESLQDWSNRAEPDLFTALAVLSNISQRLADMHDAGYVHRDLKPANVMWLPRENRWTVIDFGCVARIGESVSLSFTLAYAAPEVVHCVYANQYTMEASPALDAWSLGVMAFELLTGAPAFQMVTDGRCKVISMLKGDLPLPWEGAMSQEMHRKLGAFKGLVLHLLRRNPRRRVSLRHFTNTCTRLFDSRTTIEA